jgi:hypothetical protein
MSAGAGPVLLRNHWFPCLLVLACAGTPATRAAGAQQIASRTTLGEPTGDSVDVVASSAYLAGGLHRFLLGGRYRQVWAAPIRVAVLDLNRFAGGLTPKERGGGFQTRSLRLEAADGREFRFRSVDKNPAQKLPERLRTAAVQSVVRDQTSALHPGGPLAAAAFAEALELPHPQPRLVVLPDDSRLGEFRAEFGGMLGTIEPHPEAGPDGTPGFAGFRDITDTDKLVPLLNASPDDQVDARLYLTARLLDLFLNDWDRHPGNWRWGTSASSPPRRWIPIAKDRDQAFAWYAGALLRVVRLGDPRLIPFTNQYNLKGLTSNAAALDRRLLAGLDRPVWDSVAHAVQRRLTDSVIAGALGRMPESYQRLTGAEIAAKLQNRRSQLPAVAGSYYARLARTVDVHGTDAAERLSVRHGAAGVVEITLARRTSLASEPHFRRSFVPGETREVRVYLHGGNDTVAVSAGAGVRVVVRIIAGGDADSLPRPGVGVRSYPVPRDAPWYPDDSLVTPALDRRPWRMGAGGERQPPPADRGSRVRPSLATAYVSDLGVVLNGEVALVRYGFRTEPHASRLSLGVAHATAVGTWRVTLSGDFPRESSATFLRVFAAASGLERPWYFGMGNETLRTTAPVEAYRVSHDRYDAGAEIGRRGRNWVVAAGPLVRYARSAPAGLAAPAFERGGGTYGFAALAVRADLGRADAPGHPRRGFRLSADALIAPGVWDAPGAFGTLRASGATYLGLPLPLSPVVALRAGAARAWGPYPWFESPALGGETSLRGYGIGRFAGHSAAYGGAELRARLFEFSLGLPGDAGLVALTDVGRVWADSEESGRWHTAWGGGIWVSVVDPRATLSATLADGERTMLYVRGGFAF